MLATIVLDAYKETETYEMSEAVKSIAYFDCYASAGIYCFWDYYTKEVLYVGSSNDLFERFRQHNGLVKCNPKACKKKNIQEYFQNNEKLGYTVMLQSSLFQPLTKKYIRRRKITFDNPYADYSNIIESNAFKFVQINEGIYIESARKKIGFIPKWNIKGSHKGAKELNSEFDKLLDLFNSSITNDNVSRASIRELNNNEEYRIYECFLHGVRMSPLPVQETIELNRKIGNGFVIDLLLASNYLQKKLII